MKDCVRADKDDVGEVVRLGTRGIACVHEGGVAF